MKFKNPILALVALTAVFSIAYAADQKISELTSLPQSGWSTADVLPIVDTDANQTKKTSIGDFDLRYFNKNTDILATARGGTGTPSTASYPSSGIVATVPGTGVVKSNGSILSAGSVALGSDVTGTLPIANGGTALTSTPTNGQLLIGNGTGYSLAGLTAGSNITITSGSGSITISAASGATGTVTTVNSGTGLTGGPVTTSGTLSVDFTQVASPASVSSAIAQVPYPISSALAPLTVVGTQIQIPVATSGANGYLSSTDWTTFNSKQAAGSYVLTTRNINTTSPIIGGGDLSSDRTISMPVATSSANGYLSSTDWSTFNNKFTLPSLASGAVAFASGSTLAGLTGSVGQILYSSGSADPQFRDLQVQNTIFVDKSGNDSTCAVNAQNRPCLTVNHALALVSSPSTSNRYRIKVGVGTFTESSLALTPWTWIAGSDGILMGGDSRISLGSGNITLDPTWASGSQRGGLTNIYLTGSTGINFDRQAISGAGSVTYEFFNVGMNGSLTILSSNGALDFTDIFATRIFTNASFSGGAVSLRNSEIYGNLTVNNTGTQNFDGDFYFNYVAGNFSATQSGASTLDLRLTDIRIDGTKSIGGTANVTTPLGYYLASSTPNWSSQPTSVNDGLDKLASTGIYRSGALGDILYASGATGFNHLAIGTTGYVLTVSGGLPSWQPTQSSGGGGSGTVTTVNSGSGLLGGPITTSGTLSVDFTQVASPAYVSNAIAQVPYPISSASAPLIVSGTNISMPQATSGANGFLASADWTTFNNKFDLPSLVSGGIVIASGGSLSDDYPSFKYDEVRKSLLIGDQNVLTGDIQGAIRAIHIVSDPSYATATDLVGYVDIHYTSSTPGGAIGQEIYTKVKLDSGVTIGALGAYFAPVSRVESDDEGTVSLAGGIFTSLSQANNPNKYTAEFSAFSSAFGQIDSNPNQVGSYYDFHAPPQSFGAGAITNRYGIMIEPDSGYVKENWLSGKTTLGGASYVSGPSAALVQGGITIESEPAACTGIYSGTIRYQAGIFEGCDGSSWQPMYASGGSGANVALSNLSATAINADLIPDTNNLYAFGSQTLKWAKGFITELFDSSNISSLNAESRTLNDSTGAASLNWSAADVHSNRSFVWDSNVVLKSTDDTFTTNSVSLKSGNASGGFSSGDASFGSGTGDGGTGAVTVSSGLPSGGNSGDLNLLTGDSAAGNAGSITIKTGAASSGNQGSVAIESQAGTGGTRGDVLITAYRMILQFTHITFSNASSPPTATPDANAGTGATCTVNSSSEDNSGLITLTTGSASFAAGTQCAMTFARAWAASQVVCTVTPVDDNAAVASINASFPATTTGMNINFKNADVVGTTYNWAYHCNGLN